MLRIVLMLTFQLLYWSMLVVMVFVLIRALT